MQENDFQLTPGIRVFSFDFNNVDAYLATFDSRNQFNISIQNRLKGTQKGPNDFMLIPMPNTFISFPGEVSLSGIIYAL